MLRIALFIGWGTQGDDEAIANLARAGTGVLAHRPVVDTARPHEFERLLHGVGGSRLT